MDETKIVMSSDFQSPLKLFSIVCSVTLFSIILNDLHLVLTALIFLRFQIQQTYSLLYHGIDIHCVFELECSSLKSWQVFPKILPNF